jgi:hypothetical protein
VAGDVAEVKCWLFNKLRRVVTLQTWVIKAQNTHGKAVVTDKLLQRSVWIEG